jgi:hypothetical protein
VLLGRSTSPVGGTSSRPLRMTYMFQAYHNAHDSTASYHALQDLMLPIVSRWLNGQLHHMVAALVRTLGWAGTAPAIVFSESVFSAGREQLRDQRAHAKGILRSDKAAEPLAPGLHRREQSETSLDVAMDRNISPSPSIAQCSCMQPAVTAQRPQMQDAHGNDKTAATIGYTSSPDPSPRQRQPLPHNPYC